MGTLCAKPMAVATVAAGAADGAWKGDCKLRMPAASLTLPEQLLCSHDVKDIVCAV